MWVERELWALKGKMFKYIYKINGLLLTLESDVSEWEEAPQIKS